MVSPPRAKRKSFHFNCSIISIIIQTFAIYIFEMTAFVLLLCIVLSELLSFSLASVLIVHIHGFSFE